MRFTTFLKKELDTDDKEINDFCEWLFGLSLINHTSDPAIFGMSIMKRIPKKHIIGYKKAFLLYYAFDKNMLAKQYDDKQTFLNALNIVY